MSDLRERAAAAWSDEKDRVLASEQEEKEGLRASLAAALREGLAVLGIESEPDGDSVVIDGILFKVGPFSHVPSAGVLCDAGKHTLNGMVKIHALADLGRLLDVPRPSCQMCELGKVRSEMLSSLREEWDTSMRLLRGDTQ